LNATIHYAPAGQGEALYCCCLLTRNRNDWTYCFLLKVLRVRSCLIDGEAIAFEDEELVSFVLLRGDATIGGTLHLRPHRAERPRPAARPA
jgi:hypothetical protein